jgi:single-strand DNA-binding protein
MPTASKGKAKSKAKTSTTHKSPPDTERRVEAKGSIAKTGNLTRDMELRFGNESGVAFCRFGLAVETPKERGQWSGERDTTFYECTAFGSLAEHVVELKKGTRVNVIGQGELEHWRDGEGNNRTTKRIVVDACGPDLRWATATVERDRRQRSSAEPAAQTADTSADEDF